MAVMEDIGVDIRSAYRLSLYNDLSIAILLFLFKCFDIFSMFVTRIVFFVFFLWN